MTNDNDDELRRYIRNLEEQFNTSEQNEMQRDYDRRRQREIDTIRKRDLDAAETSTRMNKSEAENYVRNLKEEYANKTINRVPSENFWFPKNETEKVQTTFTTTYTPKVMKNKTLRDQYVDIIMEEDLNVKVRELPPKKNKMKEFMKNVLDKFKNKSKNGYKILKYYFIYGIVKILTFIGIYDVAETKKA